MMPNASRQVVLDEVKLERYRALLASTAIFRGCTAGAIDDLARRLQLRTRPAETIIVAQDEPGDSMFVIAAGRVKVALFGERRRHRRCDAPGADPGRVRRAPEGASADRDQPPVGDDPPPAPRRRD